MDKVKNYTPNENVTNILCGGQGLLSSLWLLHLHHLGSVVIFQFIGTLDSRVPLHHDILRDSLIKHIIPSVTSRISGMPIQKALGSTVIFHCLARLASVYRKKHLTALISLHHNVLSGIMLDHITLFRHQSCRRPFSRTELL